MINEQKMENFQDAFTNLYKNFFCVILNIMHGWGAVYFRICLAPKNHGYSISALNYDFYPHLAQLDNLNFTLSPNGATMSILNISHLNRRGVARLLYKQPCH